MRKATTATQVTNMGKNKDGVALGNATYERYKDFMGKVSNEISHNFSLESIIEIPHCTLATFSKFQYINFSNFIKFREKFKAKFLKGFICPAL